MVLGLLMVFLLAAPPQDSYFSVSGIVVREDNQDPATAAQSNQVRITGPSTTIVPVGEGGKFQFSFLRPGTYQIVVGPRVTMPPLTVVITDKDLTDVRVVVPVTVNVTGAVTVEGNGPRPRFQVAFTRAGPPESPAITATASPGFTAALPAGEYRIAANGLPAGYSMKSAMIGNVDAVNQTFRVATGSPAALSIVLAVSSPPWVRVSGRVTGGKATSVTMTGAPIAETLSAAVGPDGAFEFPRVLPGAYTARALPNVPFASTTPVTVAATDLTNLEVRLPASREIRGKITTRGISSSPPRLVLSVSSGPGSPAPTSVSVIDGTIVTTGGSVSIPLNPGPDGAFSVSLPEGERAISITPGSIPPEISVDSFTYGAADLLKNPIRVALNDTAEMLILVTAVEIKPHSISGKVTGLLRTDGVRVVLQGGSLGTGVESPVAPDGAFAFADVLPGTYSLRLSLSGQIIQTSVRLGNIDLTGVTINFPRRFTIAAHVLVEGDAAKLAPVPRITLEARSATGTIARASEASTGSSPLAITVSDGEHRISVSNVPAGYAVKSVRYGTLDLQKEPIKVDGPITWEIVVRLVKNQP